MLWIKEVEMVDSVDDLQSSHLIQVYTHFPNFEMLGREDCLGSEQDHPEFLLPEKGQSGGTEGPKKRIGSFAENRSLT